MPEIIKAVKAVTSEIASGFTCANGSILATWALAVIAVCLRFLARRRSKAGLWYDDWLMIPATVSIPYKINRDSSLNSRWRSAQAHMCSSSSRRRYAFSLPTPSPCVGLPKCTTGHTMINSYELTRYFYTPVKVLDVNPRIGIFIFEICWAVVIWIVKYSILAFYWRLFSVNCRSIRVIIWALVAFVTLWGLAVVPFCPSILRAVIKCQKTTGIFLTMV